MLKTCLLLYISFCTCLNVGIAQGFVNVTEDAGVDIEHNGDLIVGDWRWGTGAAWLDYDQDGLLDFYITMRSGPNKMFHNDGFGSFSEVAFDVDAEDETHDGSGASVGDINNDGYPDLYICNADEDVILLNNGGVSFTDITSTSGIDIMGARRSSSASFADVNKDGFLDIFVACHEWNKDYDIPNIIEDQQNFLWINNGNNTFTDFSNVLEDGEPENLLGYSFIGGWTDFDHDNDMDLFVINDCGFNADDDYGDTPMKLFRNLFEETGTIDFEEVGAAFNLDQCQHGMGLGVGDYNRDGWMDLIWSNIGPGQIFKNVNGTTFEDVKGETELLEFKFLEFTWGASFGDLNSDGWQDAVFASGQLEEDDQKYSWNYLYLAQGDTTFMDQKWEFGFGDKIQSRTIAMGDFDNDQDLDIIVVNYSDSLQLLRNDWNRNNICINLDGIQSNRDGIGSKIRIVTDTVVQYYETKSGSNLGAGDALAAHFGLGDFDIIDTIEIKWPSGTYQLLFDIPSDQCIEVTEEEFLLADVDLELEATRNGNNVYLSWNGSKLSDDQYSLEKSYDGRYFQTIMSWNGSNRHEYTDIEERKSVYYRLKTIGLLSSKSIYVIGLEDYWITVRPNPSFGDAWIHSQEENIGYKLIDSNGKELLRGDLIANIPTLLTDLPVGFHTLVLFDGHTHQHQSIVVVPH